MSWDGLLSAWGKLGGSLLEIYVLETNFTDWVKALESLKAAGYRYTLTTDGKLIEQLEETAFTEREDSWTVLEVLVGDQVWTSSLPSTYFIDLQGDPRLITNERHVLEVQTLMRVLHQAIGKPVVLVPETLEPSVTPPYWTVSP